ncbi:hypothetical protein, unlikely [Trypanosoma brucei gambiense DAL972]|uniref:Uncharacterized protein n=1 Tax=Trypanosoma brucei gambiense (strain MHOM/CI/86/DAL972) TaxID=679716 RepID=D0A5A1_TRYB9|nr:hypothetical protein, unlikely [Trypanosoma brucei gambiense DAL972]CBH16445.1 hypothetical protein, unlikely [Trypanosoma brucei gambiense DAL972]|eukprot:XP_011778709.1 hypothetical protein, unlikely [Trypanosoma brucei gambiense DAL972]
MARYVNRSPQLRMFSADVTRSTIFFYPYSYLASSSTFDIYIEREISPLFFTDLFLKKLLLPYPQNMPLAPTPSRNTPPCSPFTFPSPGIFFFLHLNSLLPLEVIWLKATSTA